LAVKTPGFGDKKKQTLEDIALITGAQVISSEAGGDFPKIVFFLIFNGILITLNVVLSFIN
ncbi:MAG: hypothetical protein ACTS7D_01110, partial [Candidatus Hodgkinia cicadicola]